MNENFFKSTKSQDIFELYSNLNSIANMLEDNTKLDEEVKYIFQLYDEQNKKYISKNSFREIYIQYYTEFQEVKTFDFILKNFLNRVLSEEEIERTYSQLDENNRGFLDYDRVRRFVLMLGEKLLDPIIEKTTHFMFEKYRIEKSKGLTKTQFKEFYFGFYDYAPDDLKKNMMNEKTIEKAWKELDEDNSQILEFNEIKQMFKKILLFFRKKNKVK